MENKLYIEAAAALDCMLPQTELKSFNQSLFVITSLFDRVLDINLSQVQKIRVHLSETIDNVEIDAPDEVSPIIHVQLPFDFNHYFALDKAARRAHITKTLHLAFEKLCSESGYDCQPFYQAYKKIKDMDYQNEYIHGNLKSAPDRRHKAGIHIRVEEEYAAISALVQDKEGNETARIALLRTLPHYMFIYKFIHHTKWPDKDHFQINDKSGQVVFTINVPQEIAEMHLVPKTMTLPELVQEVTQATADEI